MDAKRIRDSAVRFLRTYAHLDSPDSPPEFTSPAEPEFFHPLARYPWYRGEPEYYRPPMKEGAVYERDYRGVLDGTPELTAEDFKSLPLQYVPDSDEFVLVDVGSSLGRGSTRDFARRKPNVRVYMIDKIGDWFLERVQDSEKHYSRTDIAGKELTRFVMPYTPYEEWANELFRENGYHNVRFIHRQLKGVEKGSTNLGDISNYLRCRNVVFTGFLNPVGLGNITASEAIYHNARMLFLNNSALEQIPPNDNAWNLMRRFLGDSLSEKEIEKLISLIWDPEHELRKPARKYRTEVEGIRMFTNVLKTPFVLAQADLLESAGMNTKLHLNVHRYGYPDYNQPSHNMIATRR